MGGRARVVPLEKLMAAEPYEAVRSRPMLSEDCGERYNVLNTF